MREKNTIKLKMVFMIFLSCMVLMLFIPSSVQAASKKTQVLKAYAKFLSKKQIKWRDYQYTDSNKYSFAIAYIDKNDIPELIIQNSETMHIMGSGTLYTYQNGKVKMVQELHLDDGKFFYYKKKSVFMDQYVNLGALGHYYRILKGNKAYNRYTMFNYNGYKPNIYYKDNGGSDYAEISQSQFNKAVKSLTGAGKTVKAKFYKNTSSNRKKYLK